MKKGGYKIIDFEGTELSSSAVEMLGIFEQIMNNYGKPILVSGVIIDGELQDDAYADVKGLIAADFSKYLELTVYGGVITVTEDDDITFAVSETTAELAVEIGDLEDLNTTDKDSAVDAINENVVEILKRVSKKNYSIQPSGELTLTRNELPNRYILAFTGATGSLNAIYIGVGYGATADVRHFVTKVAGHSNPDITITPATDDYGLNIVNGVSTISVSLSVINLD